MSKVDGVIEKISKSESLSQEFLKLKTEQEAYGFLKNIDKTITYKEMQEKILEANKNLKYLKQNEELLENVSGGKIMNNLKRIGAAGLASIAALGAMPEQQVNAADLASKPVSEMKRIGKKIALATGVAVGVGIPLILLVNKLIKDFEKNLPEPTDPEIMKKAQEFSNKLYNLPNSGDFVYDGKKNHFTNMCFANSSLQNILRSPKIMYWVLKLGKTLDEGEAVRKKFEENFLEPYVIKCERTIFKNSKIAGIKMIDSSVIFNLYNLYKLVESSSNSTTDHSSNEINRTIYCINNLFPENIGPTMQNDAQEFTNLILDKLSNEIRFLTKGLGTMDIGVTTTTTQYVPKGYDETTKKNLAFTDGSLTRISDIEKVGKISKNDVEQADILQVRIPEKYHNIHANNFEINISELIKTQTEPNYMDASNGGKDKRTGPDHYEVLAYAPKDSFILHLSRMNYYGGTEQLNTPVTFDEKLELAGSNFEVEGVVCHSGTGSGGHYITFRKMSDGWHKMNDMANEESVKKIYSFQDVVKEARETGYLFFYDKAEK